MATDPVEQVQERFIAGTDFAFNLGSRIKRYAGLAPSPVVPYLTATLDLRPEGGSPERRSGTIFFEQEREALLGRYPAHSPEHVSLQADLARIAAALEGIDAAVRGAVFIACDANGVFERVLLGVPVANALTAAPTPALLALARVADDRPPYAVLLADQLQATLTVVARNQPQYELSLEASGYPRKQQQGGWSQRRYQQRADERVEAFARTIAAESGRALRELGVDILVLAGEEQMTHAIRGELDVRTAGLVAGSVRLPVESGLNEIVDATTPIVEAEERRREADAVAALEEGAGPGGGSVTGPEATLVALQAGQVMTLVMNADFAAPGWADYALPLFGVGNPPAEHPAGGDAATIVPVALEQEMVRLALQTAERIEFVETAAPVGADELPAAEDGRDSRPEPARRLDALGGVGAVLRFVLDDDRSTAEL